MSVEPPQLENTTIVKQESSQVQQLVPEQEPEPKSFTLKDSGITTEPRHKTNIDVLMSVHLDDETTINILKELEVNVQISRLSEAEIKDATLF